MSVYDYLALKNGSEIVRGKIEASSLKEARELVRNMNLVPTKISDQTSGHVKTQVVIKKEKPQKA